MLLLASNGNCGFMTWQFQTSEIVLSLSTGVCGCAQYNFVTSATSLLPGKKNCSFASTEN